MPYSNPFDLVVCASYILFGKQEWVSQQERSVISIKAGSYIYSIGKRQLFANSKWNQRSIYCQNPHQFENNLKEIVTPYVKTDQST